MLLVSLIANRIVYMSHLGRLYLYFTYHVHARAMLKKMVAQLTPLIKPRAIMSTGNWITQLMYLTKKIWYVAASPRWSWVSTTEKPRSEAMEK